MNLKNRFFVFLLAVLAGATSCMKQLEDVKGIEWEISPEFGLPLAKAELSFNNTFNFDKDSSISIYPGSDGVLHLKVEKELLKTSVNEVFDEFVTDDIWPAEEIPLPEIPGGIVISSSETNFTVLLDSFLVDQQVDSLLLNSGKLQFTFQTLESYTSASFSIRLPNVKDASGKIVAFDDFVPKKGNNFISMDLKNCKLLFNTGPKTKGRFTISLGYEIVGKNITNPDIYPYIDFGMSGIDVKSVYGKLGNFKADYDEVIDLFTDKPLEGQNVDFDLKDPVINLLVLNQVGIPLQFDLKKSGVYVGGIYEELTGIPSKILIDAPTLGNKGYIKSLLSLSPQNNIDRLMSKFPDSLKIAGTLSINPDNPGRSNFIREEDTLIARIEADIPMSFSLTRIAFDQSSPIDLTSLQEIENNLEVFKIQVKVKNSFPFELNMQAYFTDSKQHVVDSMFKEPVLIKASPTAGTINESVFWVDKNNSQIRTLKNCTDVNVRAGIKTAESAEKIVNFLSTEKLAIDINGFTKIKL